MSEMGPVERELRRWTVVSEWAFAVHASPRAWRLVTGACDRLGFFGSTLVAENHGCLSDVFSEAIEAAHELGL